MPVFVLVNLEVACEHGQENDRSILRRDFRFRLSNASFVSCAAAVGGERTAAASTPHAPSQKSKGKNTKKAARSGSGKGVGDGSDHDKDAPGVGVGGRDEVAEPRKGGPTACWGDEAPTIGVAAVAEELSRRARVPRRRASGSPLYFAFDHCFSVRGQGTILTGTVLTGELKVSPYVFSLLCPVKTYLCWTRTFEAYADYACMLGNAAVSMSARPRV